MSNENQENVNVNEEVKNETPSTDVQELVNAEVSKAIKNIKGNLDNAYNERDTYKAEILKIKADAQANEIATLEKQGKHQEVMAIQMQELTKKLETYEQKNTELSRDNAVRAQLNGLDFKNEKAANMAYSDIVNSLTKNADGNWMHSSGVTINEAVTSYSKDDSNAFLFNVKANAGSGITPAKSAVGQTPTKSIKEMSQDEVLKAVADGSITTFGDWTN
tara:strand:+ start:847 stop:1503 length:657 start_codon:yes stop_codon:yes gene_type:complete